MKHKTICSEKIGFKNTQLERNTTKKKIAFVWYGESTFIEQDAKLLEKHFEVRKLQFSGINSIYETYKAVRWADVSFCQFADVWTFFAVLFSKLFRKKSIVVVGGYDVACEPQINYGMCTKSRLRQWMRSFTINYCDFILAVSDNIKRDCYKYLKHPRDVFVVNNGYDVNKFKVDVNTAKHSVLTVASGRENIIRLKGLDTFVEVAKHFREVNFIIVGIPREDNRKQLMKTDNVFNIGKRSQGEVIKYYQQAKVYCQLSLREGHPNALCEAMLCGCVPVGSDCDGVKNVIGETGFIVPYDNVKATVNAIEEALHCEEKGQEARRRICELYPLEKREKQLVGLIQSLKMGKRK